jgi:hypothetical protein
MSSPFDDGRDSATGGFGFGEESDVADEHVGAVNEYAKMAQANRLNEEDYRD